MSPTIGALIINFLVMILPAIGIDIGAEALETTVQTLVTFVTGVIIWVRHINLKRSLLGAANINAFGGVKK